MKKSLEKGKEIENKWNNNKLALLINNWINIENNIKEINSLNDIIEKFQSLNINILFFPNKEEVD